MEQKGFLQKFAEAVACTLLFVRVKFKKTFRAVINLSKNIFSNIYIENLVNSKTWKLEVEIFQIRITLLDFASF